MAMIKPESTTDATKPPWRDPDVRSTLNPASEWRDPNAMTTLNPTPTLSPAAQLRWDCLTLAAEVCEGESSEDIVRAAEEFFRFVIDA